MMIDLIITVVVIAEVVVIIIMIIIILMITSIIKIEIITNHNNALSQEINKITKQSKLLTYMKVKAPLMEKLHMITG